MLTLQTDEADAAAADWLAAAESINAPRRSGCGWLGGPWPVAACAPRRICSARPRRTRRPTAVAILQVELLTLEGRVEEALELGSAALDAARLDEHAELCLQLARAAITAGRWGRADDFVDPRRAARAGPVVDPARRLRPRRRSGGRRPTGWPPQRCAPPAPNPPSVLCEALCVRGRIHRLSDVGRVPRQLRRGGSARERTRIHARGGSRRCSVSARSNCWRTSHRRPCSTAATGGGGDRPAGQGRPGRDPVGRPRVGRSTVRRP